jgi:hypothetical protein
MSKDLKKPAKLRSMFGSNLRSLAKGYTSIFRAITSTWKQLHPVQ